MICQRCSANNDNGELFCYNCGARLERDAAAVGTPTIVMPSQTPPQIPQPPAAPQQMAPPSYGWQPSGGQPMAYGTPQATSSTAAIISLIFGIVSWFALPLIGALIAIVSGHMARGEIRRSGGNLGGDGMAMAGLILGYLNLLVTIGVICVFFMLLVAAGSAAD